MKRKHLFVLKWFYPVLFTLYVSGITLFTHTHIVNSLLVVHSHPFKFTDSSTHEHSEKEIQLLDQIFNTSITNDIVPSINLSGILSSNTIYYPDLNLQDQIYRFTSPLHLRAPPC